MITAAAVLAGKAAPALVEAAEQNSEAEAAESVADCTFGDGRPASSLRSAVRWWRK